MDVFDLHLLHILGSIDYIWQAKIHNPKTCIHWKSQAQ